VKKILTKPSISIRELASLPSSSVDDYIKQCSERIAKQIDYDVMAKLFVESGWHRVKLDDTSSTTDDEIFNWVYNDQNIKGHAHGFENDWVFELKADADWFKLRWLS
jgi:hypothetical protein